MLHPSWPRTYQGEDNLNLTLRDLPILSLQVTVVGIDGRLVYESLVVPDNEIIDFNTRFSGIAAKDLGKGKSELKNNNET